MFLDYTFGGAPTDQGSDDLIHGEDGDDTIYGMVGNDVIFGEGQDDDLFGGAGSDRIYGGTGEDGILGDDGWILTSRNGLTEPLNLLFAPNLLHPLRARRRLHRLVRRLAGPAQEGGDARQLDDRRLRHHLRRPRRRLHARRRR